MKGFGIEIKNNLLDPKHVRNMGSAVWLYMWYLDKMTAVNDNEIGKVLGGQPITFDMVEVELGGTRRTYVRWVARLRDKGYINTIQAPTGLVVTVNKAFKEFRKKRSDKNDTSYQENSDVTKMALYKSDVTKSVKGSAKKVHPNKTVLLRNTKDSTQVLTKVNTVSPVFDDGTPDPRNQEVQKVVEHFEKRIGKMPQAGYQRRAALTLVQRHGFDRVIGGINLVATTRGAQFAPNITSLSALRDKWLDLENFCARIKSKKGGVAVIR